MAEKQESEVRIAALSFWLLTPDFLLLTPVF